MIRLPRAPHSWTLSPARAIALQRQMAGQVVQLRPRKRFRFVAGLDAAFSSDETECVGAVVLWDLRRQKVVEQHLAAWPLRFPYIPGLLSFREAPALLAALRKLSRKPDVLLCDGQGLAHPRRFGLACHLGVICDLPAIGCAKSRLVGTHAEVPHARGGRAVLVDRGEPVGLVVRTQPGIRPLYVSVGHKLDAATAARVVLACAVRYRLPEPLRWAHRLVTAARRAGRTTGPGMPG